MPRFKGFARVAASFAPIKIRLAVTALEGAGFTTIAPNLRMTETMPMNSLAFGPLEVYVPEGDAEDAKAVLEAIADGTVVAQDMPDMQDEDPEAPQPRKKGLFLNLLGVFLAGLSNPLKGLSVDARAGRDQV